ncbi:MAG: N-formylglutamate amidohydrolase [Sedimentisphaerales bacterium]|nr:N-formylglutamate amidohydrolase [Sedimentisphaerales bacterium]
MKIFDSIVLSCEHATNVVPSCYKSLFHGYQKILQTHRAYDIGIRQVALYVKQYFHCLLFEFPITRLLIDANRSPGYRLYSEFSRPLSKPEKERLFRQYYQPYREKVTDAIRHNIQQGKTVLHLSLHSFTPVWKDKPRYGDIGILYDPSCPGEKQAAIRLQSEIAAHSNYAIRRNYPYRGISDGFTTWLRSFWSDRDYLGFEIEINQAILISAHPSAIRSLTNTICQSLHTFMQ